MLLAVVVLLALLLTGCDMILGREHSHNLIWINGNNPKMAFQFCTGCLRRVNTEDIYGKALTIGMPGGDYEDGSIDAPIGYDIELDSGMYEYGEEININLKKYFGYPYYTYFSNGDLHVKIAESEYYEIVGRDEYVVEDFNSEKAKDTKKISYKFTIKATEACSTEESVEFKIKANFDEAYWRGMTTVKVDSPKGWLYDNSQEYSFSIYSLGFKTDSLGIILGENSEVIFYDSINREYLNGILSKDDYACKVYEYCLKDRPIVDIDYDADLIGRITNESYFIYKTKYIRAEFYFTTNRDYFMSLYDDKENPVESDIELKKGLIKILYDEGYISSEEYECEINYIEESENKGGLRHWPYDMMPAARYVKKVNHYTYREEDRS